MNKLQGLRSLQVFCSTPSGSTRFTLQQRSMHPVSLSVMPTINQDVHVWNKFPTSSVISHQPCDALLRPLAHRLRHTPPTRLSVMASCYARANVMSPWFVSPLYRVAFQSNRSTIKIWTEREHEIHRPSKYGRRSDTDSDTAGSK